MSPTDESAVAVDQSDPDTLRDRVRQLLDDAAPAVPVPQKRPFPPIDRCPCPARDGERETIEFEDARDAQITVYRGQRTATSSTSDLSESGLADALASALEMARFTEADEYAGLADADRMARDWPALSLDHPWTLSAEDGAALAIEAEASALGVDDRIERSEGATVATGRGVSVYGNSHGFIGAESSTHHAISCSAIASHSGAMQREMAASQARAAADLDDPSAIGRLAGQRAVARLNARTPPTTAAPVLFVPRVARGLWGHLLSAISGGALYRNASFLKDCLDQPIAASAVHLVQSPHRPKGLASTGFDGDGVATVDRTLVEDGVLRGYLLGSYSARRLGLATTGNAGGVFNPEITPGTDDFDALVAGMKRGLVATELMGQGVNLTNGDYSRGAAGFWVENGEIAYPVENATIAGNLADMYRSIEALGNDVDVGYALHTPSVLVAGMTIAGQ